MERYDVKEQIGEGTFGTVYYALKKSTGDKVREICIALNWIALESGRYFYCQ